MCNSLSQSTHSQSPFDSKLSFLSNDCTFVAPAANLNLFPKQNQQIDFPSGFPLMIVQFQMQMSYSFCQKLKLSNLKFIAITDSGKFKQWLPYIPSFLTQCVGLLVLSMHLDLFVIIFLNLFVLYSTELLQLCHRAI